MSNQHRNDGYIPVPSTDDDKSPSEDEQTMGNTEEKNKLLPIDGAQRTSSTTGQAETSGTTSNERAEERTRRIPPQSANRECDDMPRKDTVRKDHRSACVVPGTENEEDRSTSLITEIIADDMNKRSFGSRFHVFATFPHLAALCALVILIIYAILNVNAEKARHEEAESMQQRCAFVYLANENRSDIENLKFSLKALNKNFKAAKRYEIVIVHENIPPVVQGKLQSISEARLDFRAYTLTQPKELNLSDEVPTFTRRARWSYQNMVRFWFYTAMFAEPTKKGLLSDLDYIVRLDSDSAFTGSIKRDFIREFVVSGAQYGYYRLGQDCRRNMSYGLRELAESYIELNGIKPRSTNLWKKVLETEPGGCIPAFDNHMEVLNMRFFRSHSGIQDWIRLVDSNGGIYKHGWGGAVLRFVTIALYAAPEKLVRYDNESIPYRHPHRMGNR